MTDDIHAPADPRDRRRAVRWSRAVMMLGRRRIRSFRREQGGLYEPYVAVVSRAYRAAMWWQHRGAPSFRSDPLLADGEPAPPIEVFAGRLAERERAIQAHCRRRRVYCDWCGRRGTAGAQ